MTATTVSVPPVEHDEIASDEVARVVRRRCRQASEQRLRNRIQPLLQSWRQPAALAQLLRETWR
jgi:hypothetical protein